MDEGDPDGPLISGVAQGDPAAVRRLVSAKLPRILSFASRLLHDRAEAEDVAQEAFLKVWSQARRWRTGEARFDTWLYTVVLNICRDRIRKRKTFSDEALVSVMDPNDTPEQALMAAERESHVANAIRALPERQREAILLVHYADHSGSDAAAVLGVSLEALESLLSRGRRTLRASLTPRRGDDADA